GVGPGASGRGGGGRLARRAGPGRRRGARLGSHAVADRFAAVLPGRLGHLAPGLPRERRAGVAAAAATAAAPAPLVVRCTGLGVLAEGKIRQVPRGGPALGGERPGRWGAS